MPRGGLGNDNALRRHFGRCLGECDGEHPVLHSCINFIVLEIYC